MTKLKLKIEIKSYEVSEFTRLTNLTRGSIMWRNVVGDAINWPMGLAVAPAINLKTLSAAKVPAGTHWDQFEGSALSLLWPFEALILSLVFLAKMVWFGLRTWEWRFGKSAEFGGGRVIQRKVAAWLQLMGGSGERQLWW